MAGRDEGLQDAVDRILSGTRDSDRRPPRKDPAGAAPTIPRRRGKQRPARPDPEREADGSTGSAARKEAGQSRARPPEGRGDRDGEPDKQPRSARRGNAARAMHQQERLRSEQTLREARELEERAKELKKKAKQRRQREESYERHRERVSEASGELGLAEERPITEMPEPPAGFDEVEMEAIQEPFSFVRVSFNESTSEYLYEVLEPQLTETEAEVLRFLRETLIRTLDGRGKDGDDPADTLTDALQAIIADHAVFIDDISTQRIEYYILRDFLGYGVIDALMRDPRLEDISCDGPGVPLYLFHRDHESIRTNVVFADDLSLDSFVIRLAQQSGKHISIAEPMLDATLPDGSRLQATLSREVTTRGSSFTIRRFRDEPLTPPRLMEYGTFDDRMAAYFWFLMENGQSLLMAGGTASGKTTTLNAVCQFIPPEKKIVSIEDTREINLRHDNWIAGVTRAGFGGTDAAGRRAGSIDMYNLLEAALRQRPEFLLVGEVRGKEALTLFQAMATGHAVYSTMHADSPESAVYRLENPPIEVPRMMLQTLDAMAIQAQVRIQEQMVRRVVGVTEFVGFDPETGDLLTNNVFEWDVATDTHSFTGKSFLLDRIMERENLSAADMEAEWDRRQRVLRWMHEKDIADLESTSRILSAYYHQRDELMDRVDAGADAGDLIAPRLDPSATEAAGADDGDEPGERPDAAPDGRRRSAGGTGRDRAMHGGEEESWI